MPIPVGYAQANFKFGGPAAPNGAECTLGIDLGSFSDGPGDLATALGGMWAANILPTQVDDISLVSVLVKYGPDATGPSAEVAVGSSGSNSNPGTTPAVALLVQKTTAAGGRAGRGRMYVPGYNENLFDEAGVISGANLEALQEAWGDFYDALTVGDFGPVLLHGEGSPISTPTEITGFDVSSVAATQRRRQRR